MTCDWECKETCSAEQPEAGQGQINAPLSV